MPQSCIGIDGWMDRLVDGQSFTQWIKLYVFACAMNQVENSIAPKHTENIIYLK